MAKNQEIYFTKSGRLKIEPFATSGLNVDSAPVVIGTDGSKILKLRVYNRVGIARTGTVDISIGGLIFDQIDGSVFSTPSSTDVLINVPVDSNGNKYLNLEFGQDIIMVNELSAGTDEVFMECYLEDY